MPADQRRTARLALVRARRACGRARGVVVGRPGIRRPARPERPRPRRPPVRQRPASTPARAGHQRAAVGGGGRPPAEARHTLDLIAAGGPYPYSRDGVVFQNRERLLPRKTGGYYHEYTVPTPGEGDRGAGGSSPARAASVLDRGPLQVVQCDRTQRRGRWPMIRVLGPEVSIAEVVREPRAMGERCRWSRRARPRRRASTCSPRCWTSRTGSVATSTRWPTACTTSPRSPARTAASSPRLGRRGAPAPQPPRGLHDISGVLDEVSADHDTFVVTVLDR